MSAVQDSPPQDQQRSVWSVKVAVVSGIPVRLHFTFVLFMAWVGFEGWQQGSWAWPLLILTLFVCVVLHELGHALTALHYGVRTRDITLYPIGGVAMLQGKPTPKQELWIALAGPLVNLVIAALLALVATLTSSGISLQVATSGKNFIWDVVVANLTLALFNLIPAFPMDGGRVLRAALALKMPEVQATHIAATIGQFLAILIGLFGLYAQSAILMLVAFFVYIAAGQEAKASMLRTFMTGHSVKEAMQTRFRTIEHGATIEEAAEMLLAGSQHEFPVTAGGEYVGILTSQQIARGLATTGSTAYVAEFMDRKFNTARADLPLITALELIGQPDTTPILVLEEEKLIGMLTNDNLSEFIMLQAARKNRVANT